MSFSARKPKGASGGVPPHPPDPTDAMYALNAAFAATVFELDDLMLRRFTERRELVVERESEKHWTATIDDDKVLYRSPDYQATMRFAMTFAERTHGVRVVALTRNKADNATIVADYSVKVPPDLRVVS